jgi:hypothetical protein
MVIFWGVVKVFPAGVKKQGKIKVIKSDIINPQITRFGPRIS